ncbi:hypothetical protein [Rhodobacter sp. CZR27]|nr:hypothetical protein [Rhodobacter sp. CZR27]
MALDEQYLVRAAVALVGVTRPIALWRCSVLYRRTKFCTPRVPR